MSTATIEKPVATTAKATTAKATTAKATTAKATTAKATTAKATTAKATKVEEPKVEEPKVEEPAKKRGRPAFLVDPVVLAFQVSSETKELIQKHAEANGEKLSDVLRKALDMYLSKI